VRGRNFPGVSHVSGPFEHGFWSSPWQDLEAGKHKSTYNSIPLLSRKLCGAERIGARPRRDSSENTGLLLSLLINLVVGPMFQQRDPHFNGRMRLFNSRGAPMCRLRCGVPLLTYGAAEQEDDSG